MMTKLYFFVSIVTMCLYSVKGRQPLYVGSLLELTNSWASKNAITFPKIWEFAFEEIGNRTDILADYSLQLIVKDTQGEPGLAAHSMFELVSGDVPIVCVLGPSLSSELTVVGQITPYYDVIQMSYMAWTSTTVDRSRFQTLFKVNHIRDNLNPLRIKMMKYFNWTRVGTIFTQDEVEVSEMIRFHDLLKQHNLTLVTSAIIPNDNADVSYMIARLKQYDARIIMGSFHFGLGAKIFCEAYKHGLYGSNHVWILSNSRNFDNWISESASQLKELNCTMDELLKATDGYFTLTFNYVSTVDTHTISGKTPTELSTILEEKLSETNDSLGKYYGWAYDSAWALALGLNNSLRVLGDGGLYNYTNNQYYLKAIFEGMHDVHFDGLSGPVSFNELGGRIGVTYIEQNFNDKGHNVASYNEITDTLTWFVPVDHLWPDGIVPRDSFIYQRVDIAPNIPCLLLILLANTICCLMAIGFLSFNIYYRKNSYIKLSSPKINNIMILGSIMLFVCVYISSLDYGHLLEKEPGKTVCMARVWTMCLGFTSLFGALFSKTWRVHKLFRDNSLKKTVIMDYHLYGVIGFLLFCDCILLVPWTITHALEKKSVVRNIKDFRNVSVIISEVYTYCHHPNETYWYISVYIYKGLLLAFGVFLAWETRYVSVPVLNDSKYIGFCIYNVVIVCVFGVPLAHVLPTEQTTLNFVLLSALVIFCTTMCLCILFIPKTKLRNKIRERFLNPSLNSVTNPTVHTASVGLSSSPKSHQPTIISSIEVEEGAKPGDTNKEHGATIEGLKLENNRLRMKLASETIAIARLKRDLLQFTGNIHFYKTSDRYVVFKAAEDSRLQLGSSGNVESSQFDELCASTTTD